MLVGEVAGSHSDVYWMGPMSFDQSEKGRAFRELVSYAAAVRCIERKFRRIRVSEQGQGHRLSAFGEMFPRRLLTYLISENTTL